MTKQQLETQFDTFLRDNNNTFVKVLPNKNSPQCFDLAVKWTNILGIPHAAGNPSPFPYVNAFQIYRDYGAPQSIYFDRIANTPDYVPQKGDIVVWSSSYNSGEGHVAVATGQGDTNTFQAFSQNVPVGSNAHLVRFSYGHVLGALRLKVTEQPIMDNIKRKSYFFDIYWQALHGAQTNTDLVTEQEVKKRIVEALSEKKRAGQYDQLARKAGYEGDTNTLTYEKLYDLVLTEGNKKFQEAYQKLLAEKNSIRQKIIEDIEQLLNNLKS